MMAPVRPAGIDRSSVHERQFEACTDDEISFSKISNEVFVC